MKLRDHKYLETEGAKYFEEVLARLKMDQNDPKYLDLSVGTLPQHFFLEIGLLIFSDILYEVVGPEVLKN